MYFCRQGLKLGPLIECTEVTDLRFLIATHSFSTPLSEGDEPSRECPTKAYSVSGGGQRLYKGYSMPLGDFAFVPIPVHVDTEA